MTLHKYFQTIRSICCFILFLISECLLIGSGIAVILCLAIGPIIISIKNLWMLCLLYPLYIALCPLWAYIGKNINVYIIKYIKFFDNSSKPAPRRIILRGASGFNISQKTLFFANCCGSSIKLGEDATPHPHLASLRNVAIGPHMTH
jgi:hypothetical protein